MTQISVTLACGEYDRTQPLMDGAVRPEGIDLTYLNISPPSEIFRRMLHDKEFEASEMSLSNYLMGLSQGDRRFVAIPVFPSRTFRHSYIWVNAHAGVKEPRDLIGKRMGCPDYSMTAMLFIRGLLQHEYAVPPHCIQWVRGRPEKTSLKLPDGIHVEDAPPGRGLDEMLESGELAAVGSASVPRCAAKGSSAVKRLFPHPREVEAGYFRKTGIFPIMHLVVLRRDVYEEYPWAAASLARAFQEAKIVAYERRKHSPSLYSLPWAELDLEECKELFGDDAYPYGIAANTATLEAALAYSYEQGLSDRPLAIDELFAPEATAELS